MTYSEEQYNSLLAVCRSYKNDYDNAFERLKSQQREIERLKSETAKEIFTEERNLVKEFAEQLKARITKFIWRHNIPECIFNDIMSDLLKEYEE